MSNTGVNKLEAAWTQAMVRSWTEQDPEFRARLLQNPRAVLIELGAQIPEDIRIRVIENDLNELTFVLPPPPEDLEKLSDAQISELYSACPGTVCVVSPDDM